MPREGGHAGARRARRWREARALVGSGAVHHRRVVVPIRAGLLSIGPVPGLMDFDELRRTGFLTPFWHLGREE